MAARTWGILLVMLSLVPLGFLVYTLTHLDVLNISVSHPRVIVELSLFIFGLFAGIILIVKSV